MRRFLLIAALLLPLPAQAQILSPSPQSISAVFSSACTSTTCATWVLGQSSSITLGITGTFSGTITFYGSSDGGVTYVAIGAIKLSDGTLTTTTTATGQFSIANSGLTHVQARFTAYTSGGANITASRGYASAKLVPFSSGVPVPASSGGTGISSYTIGDMLYASGTTTLSKLAASTSGFVLTANGAGVAPSWQAISGGDVVGPASSTDNAIVRFDGTTGKLVQNGVVLIGDTGAVTGVTTIATTIPTASTAYILGTADTNGIRLDLESGVMAVREGDDSAYARINSDGFVATDGTTIAKLITSGIGTQSNHQFEIFTNNVQRWTWDTSGHFAANGALNITTTGNASVAQITATAKVIFDGTTTSSGAGAVGVTGSIHEITTTGTGDALTLANGTEGQRLTIVYVAEGAGTDTAVVTPSNFGSGSTITFSAPGQVARLIFTNGKWYADGATFGAVIA